MKCNCKQCGCNDLKIVYKYRALYGTYAYVVCCNNCGHTFTLYSFKTFYELMNEGYNI